MGGPYWDLTKKCVLGVAAVTGVCAVWSYGSKLFTGNSYSDYDGDDDYEVGSVRSRRHSGSDSGSGSGFWTQALWQGAAGICYDWFKRVTSSNDLSSKTGTGLPKVFVATANNGSTSASRDLNFDLDEDELAVKSEKK